MPDIQTFKLQITTDTNGTCTIYIDGPFIWCSVPLGADLPAAIFFDISPNELADPEAEFTALQVFRVYDAFALAGDAPVVRQSCNYMMHVSIPSPIYEVAIEEGLGGYTRYDFTYSMAFRGRGTVTKVDPEIPANNPLTLTINDPPSHGEGVYVIDITITGIPTFEPPAPRA